MKKLIFILCLVLLNSYSYSNPSYNDRLLENIKKFMPKEISKKRLVERRGLVYEVNSTIPFMELQQIALSVVGSQKELTIKMDYYMVYGRNITTI